jgi:hypothetical protein
LGQLFRVSTRNPYVKSVFAFAVDYIIIKPNCAPLTSGVMRKVGALDEWPCLRILIYIYRDLALEVYRNASIEKVAYIRHLMQRAQKEDKMRTHWQSLLLVRQPTFLCSCLSISSNFHRISKALLTAFRHPRHLLTRFTLISQPKFFMNCSR